MSLLELFNLSASIFTLPNNDGFPGIFPAPSFRDYLEDLLYYLRTHMPYAQDVYQNLVYRYLVAEAIIFYLFLMVGMRRFRLAQVYLLVKVPTFALLFLSSGTSYLNILAWILCPLAYPVELLAGVFLSFWAFHRSSIARFDKEFGGVPVWNKKLVAVKKRNGGTRWKEVEYVSHILSQFYPDRLIYHVAFTCFYAYAKYRMILGNPLAALLQVDLQDDLDNTFLVEGLTYWHDDRGDEYPDTWTTDVTDTLYNIAVERYPISKEFHKRDALSIEMITRLQKPTIHRGQEWEKLDSIFNWPLNTLFGIKFPWTVRSDKIKKELADRWLPENRPFEWVTTSTSRTVMNFEKRKSEKSDARALRIIRRNLYHKTEAPAPIPAPNLQGLSQRIVENLSTDQFNLTKEVVLSSSNKLRSELNGPLTPFPFPAWRFRFNAEHYEKRFLHDVTLFYGVKMDPYEALRNEIANRHHVQTGISWTRVKPKVVRHKLSPVERTVLYQPNAKIWVWKNNEVVPKKPENHWQKRYVEPEIRTGFTGFNFEQFVPLMELDSISNLRYGLLFILALSSLTVYSIILAGWSSNSKYAFLGALRSAAQMISYEVSISLALLPVILLSGSLNLTAIVYGQIGTVWYLFPLLPIALVFLVSMLAETNRTPFDLPEAEAELVAGYNVDYSSLPFAMFFLGEYSNMILISVLFCLLFLGGWDGAVIALQEPYVLTIKAAVVWVFFVIVRATLPRYRYDQLMDIGWKAFLPFAGSFLVFVIGLVIFLDVAPVVEEVALEDLYGAPTAFTAENSPTTLATHKLLTELPVIAFQPPEIYEPITPDYPLLPYHPATISTMNLFNYSQRPVNSRNPLSTVLSNHLLCYPTPSSLTYNWSFGSLAGLFFALQLITGIFLAMHYTPHVEWAFQSVEHIMTDVTSGYMFRYFHANGASAIFILIYAHMARGLYYQSYVSRSTLWITGVVIFLLMMATAFIGYVLPWGQMSFWGATVITSLVTAVPLVGEDIAYWIWGGFSVGNATLTRFFSLHFLLPFVILAVILFLHLMVLHTDGSTEPFVLPLTPSKIPFHPYYTLKDTFIFYVSLALFGLLVFYVPNLLGHSDNFLPANPLVTPAHIVPEWYFTPYYAILRACPDKIGGALGMFAAIIVLVFLGPIVKTVDSNVVSFSPFATLHKVLVGIFYANFLNLIYLGSSPAAAPYIISSKTSTGIYFWYLLFVLPLLAYLNREVLAEVEKDEEKAATTTLSENAISFATSTICTTATVKTVDVTYGTTTNAPPGNENY